MSGNASRTRIRVDDLMLQDFKATMDEHVYVTTDQVSQAAELPLIYAVAVCSFLRGLGINATLDPVK
jgi:hypothetical protein